jgi:hypothetical protein
MDFLVAGSSLGQNLDEGEEYGLQAPPASISTSEERQRVILSDLSPAEKISNALDDLLPPRSEAEEVALYEQVMREEALQKAALEKNSLDEEEDEQQAEEVEQPLWQPAKPPPPGLFRSGILPFLFDLNLQIRLGGLVVAFCITFFLLDKALALISVRGILTWFAGMFFLAVSVVFALGSFIYAAALVMSVLVDTSNGQKRIESWPTGFIFEWLQEASYLAGAIFWSALPSVPLGWALESSGIPPGLITAACMAIFFPLALMAALEAGIFFFPGTPAVWLSPFHAGWAWLDFYLITLPLITLIAGVAIYAFQEDIAWMVLLSAFLTAVGSMLYFRLLGRLAWYAAGRAETTGE